MTNNSIHILIMMKGGIPRKGLIAHWQNSDVSSHTIVDSTFLYIYFFLFIESLYIHVHEQRKKTEKDMKSMHAKFNIHAT